MGRKQAKRYPGYNAKAYRFTQRRRAALKRAQAISARKRKMAFVKVGVVAASVGAGIYLGRNTAIGKSVRSGVADSVRRIRPPQAQPGNIAGAIRAVQPDVKEAVRQANAISPAHAPRPTIGIGSAPHVPGDGNSFTDAKPPEINYTRTRLPDQIAQEVRDAMAQEDAAKFEAKGDAAIARFVDTSESSLAAEGLVRGQPVHRGAAARAVGMHESNKGRMSAGVPATSQERFDTASKIIGDSITAAHAVHGTQTPIRQNPKADPTNVIAPGSRLEREYLRSLLEQGEPSSPYGPPELIPARTAASAGAAVLPGRPTIGTGSASPRSTPNLSPPQTAQQAFAVGSTIAGWGRIPKAKQAEIRTLLGEVGKKVNAVGKISQPRAPGTPWGAHPAPPSNPSGAPPQGQGSPQQRGAATRRAKREAKMAERGMPKIGSRPKAGNTLPGWEHMNSAQRKSAHRYAARFHMAINPMGQYYDLID